MQPTSPSLDELLAAIRALQFQSDQEITRLLEQNAELLEALKAVLYDRELDFCGAGVMRMAQAAIANAERKPSTPDGERVGS